MRKSTDLPPPVDGDAAALFINEIHSIALGKVAPADFAKTLI
jgi:hypothetical protein